MFSNRKSRELEMFFIQTYKKNHATAIDYRTYQISIKSEKIVETVFSNITNPINEIKSQTFSSLLNSKILICII